MKLMPRIAIPAAVAMLLALPVAAPAQSFSSDQRHQIESIIKDYLVAHPEVLQEAMAALENHQQQAKTDKARATIRAKNATLFNSPHQVVLGNPNGKIAVVEFFDYNCGFCKRALPDMMGLIKTYPNLKFVLKEFPVLGQGSIEAARVAVAVRMQDPTGAKYAEFHQKLLGGRGAADEARALGVAKEVGFDMVRLKRDLASTEIKTTIDEDMTLADALGIDGTPSYIIGDQLVVGAVGFDELKQKIAALEK